MRYKKNIKYQMKIVFSNNVTIDLKIDNSPIGKIYQKTYKHLSNLSIPFSEWDNSSNYKDTLTYVELVDRLIMYAGRLSIDIDKQRCLEQDQLYFNAIHKIYEKQYNGSPGWLNFHEHIHMCETYFKKEPRIFSIDYREKMGMLERPVDRSWLDTTTTNINAGDVYVAWSELGKTPYTYWRDNEPPVIERMCELVKPWVKFVPKIKIALENIDQLTGIEIAEFEIWWEQYKGPWLQHWNLSDWTTHDIFSVKVFGKTTQLDLLLEQVKNNIIPINIII
jgi:hypothetical protein